MAAEDRWDLTRRLMGQCMQTKMGQVSGGWVGELRSEIQSSTAICVEA